VAAIADTYTAAQAAQILGITERRVRQLVSQGTLTGERTSDGTVRVVQQAVNEERKRRKKTGASMANGRPARPASTRKPAAEPVDLDSLADRVASAVGQRLEGQMEITRRAESLVRQELDEERSRRIQLEAQLQATEARLSELQAAQAAQARKRGLFRRS
jgi:excisionase family DNA binding protein